MNRAVRSYTDPQVFWDEVSAHLIHEPSKNSLLLGLANIFRTDPSGRVDQLAVFEGGRLLGAVICSKHLDNRNFLPSPPLDADAARALFNAVVKAGHFINGMVADKDTGEIYARLFSENGRQLKMFMDQGIYRCREVNKPEGAGHLKLRRAALADLDLIAEWMSRFHEEVVPHDPPSDWRAFAEKRITDGGFYLAEKDGTPVSMSAITRDFSISCTVNWVYTPKEFRKSGYASFLVSGLTQSMLDQGKKEVSLYTDWSNPTSNKIYQDVGFELVCRSAHYGIS